jgi:hypothetical protein
MHRPPLPRRSPAPPFADSPPVAAPRGQLTPKGGTGWPCPPAATPRGRPRSPRVRLRRLCLDLLQFAPIVVQGPAPVDPTADMRQQVSRIDAPRWKRDAQEARQCTPRTLKTARATASIESSVTGCAPPPVEQTLLDEHRPLDPLPPLLHEHLEFGRKGLGIAYLHGVGKPAHLVRRHPRQGSQR